MKRKLIGNAHLTCATMLYLYINTINTCNLQYAKLFFEGIMKRTSLKKEEIQIHTFT